MEIVENHTNCGVNVGYMVRRIMSFVPRKEVEGIKKIYILDYSPEHKGFARYIRDECTIEIFVREVIDWQPWVLKKTFFFPYLAVGLALGHEIDHHVNRMNKPEDYERSAEQNAMKYIYPSLGIFKPLVGFLIFLMNKRGLKKKKC